MINAYQLQNIFYLFTEKLNTSEPPPGFSKVSLSLLSADQLAVVDPYHEGNEIFPGFTNWSDLSCWYGMPRPLSV